MFAVWMGYRYVLPLFMPGRGAAGKDVWGTFDQVVALSLASGETRYVVVPENGEARYRVRERLANVPLPVDAVGATNSIAGTIVFDAAGRVVPKKSLFVINVTTLKSDRGTRDRYVQNNTLQTDEFPTVQLRPTEVRGLAFPLPTAGQATFQLVGDLRIQKTTRPATWDVTAVFEQGRVSIKAQTAILFKDFGLSQPRVPVVLSVEDTIRLEADLVLAWR